MKERKGPLGRTVDMVADTVAGTVRRRRQGRMPRALVYDADGHPTLVALAIEERGGEPGPAEDPLEE